MSPRSALVEALLFILSLFSTSVYGALEIQGGQDKGGLEGTDYVFYWTYSGGTGNLNLIEWTEGVAGVGNVIMEFIGGSVSIIDPSYTGRLEYINETGSASMRLKNVIAADEQMFSVDVAQGSGSATDSNTITSFLSTINWINALESVTFTIGECTQQPFATVPNPAPCTINPVETSVDVSWTSPSGISTVVKIFLNGALTHNWTSSPKTFSRTFAVGDNLAVLMEFPDTYCEPGSCPTNWEAVNTNPFFQVEAGCDAMLGCFIPSTVIPFIVVIVVLAVVLGLHPWENVCDILQLQAGKDLEQARKALTKAIIIVWVTVSGGDVIIIITMACILAIEAPKHKGTGTYLFDCCRPCGEVTLGIDIPCIVLLLIFGAVIHVIYINKLKKEIKCIEQNDQGSGRQNQGGHSEKPREYPTSNL